MDYLRKRFRFNYTEVENREQYRDNWERTFRGKQEEQKPEIEPPKAELQVKLAAECEQCPCCEEPWCSECSMHYADCAHPGPHSE